MNEIVKTQEQQVTVHEEKSMGQMLLEMARDPNMDVGKLQALIDMQGQMEDREARKSFNRAFQDFKRNQPRIFKNKKVEYGQTKYHHATIDSVMKQIDPSLEPFNLDCKWSINVTPDLCEVTCIISHIDGHFVESYFASKPDNNKGQMSDLQRQGSAITYGKRYTVLACLGLAEQGEDDDGVKAEMSKVVSEKMAIELGKRMDEHNLSKEAYVKRFGVDSLRSINMSQYGVIAGVIDAKERLGK